MASFGNEFWKYLFLSGVFYFIVIGTLAYIKFEPLKVKSSNSMVTSVSCFISSAVSINKLII